MGILLSEGAYSEAGFLATTDGGKTWVFYDPPSTGLASFLRVDGKCWATGHEVVGKDKPGGGLSVPLAINSDDGIHWEHSTHDIKACHWQSCGLCTTAGCLASNTLLVNFFGPETKYFAIPKGDLTAKWAVLQNMICSIHDGVTCATLGTRENIEVAGDPQPFEQSLPSLNAKTSSGNGLRCIACALEPVYVDEKLQGRFTIHTALLIRPDGTVETVKLEGAPSVSLESKLHAQMIEWLFEPPLRDGKSVRISTQTDIAINVVHSR